MAKKKARPAAKAKPKKKPVRSSKGSARLSKGPTRPKPQAARGAKGALKPAALPEALHEDEDSPEFKQALAAVAAAGAGEKSDDSDFEPPVPIKPPTPEESPEVEERTRRKDAPVEGEDPDARKGSGGRWESSDDLDGQDYVDLIEERTGRKSGGGGGSDGDEG